MSDRHWLMNQLSRRIGRREFIFRVKSQPLQPDVVLVQKDELVEQIPSRHRASLVTSATRIYIRSVFLHVICLDACFLFPFDSLYLLAILCFHSLRCWVPRVLRFPKENLKLPFTPSGRHTLFLQLVSEQGNP